MTTIHKLHIVLLSAAVSYGSGLVAMDTKGKKPERSKTEPIALTCSQEALRNQEQLRSEAKEALRNTYFAHAGGNGNTPPEYFLHSPSLSRSRISNSMKPIDLYYPHWH